MLANTIAPSMHSALLSRPTRMHGFEGFQTFSHARAVFQRGAANPWELMRPPWGETLGAFARALTGARE